MLVLAVLVGWTVRIGLRPLEDMTETAGAFAKGDLSRRVRFADERTEVGRLGGALNGMLVQIESALRQTTGVRGATQTLRRGRLSRSANSAHLDHGVTPSCCERVRSPRKTTAGVLCGVSSTKPSGWRYWSTTYCCWRASTRAGRLRWLRSSSGRWWPTLSPPPGQWIRRIRSPSRPLTGCWSRATPAGCARPSTTWCATPSCTPRPGPRSRCAITTTPTAVRVSVADTGPGVRADQARACLRAVLPGRPVTHGSGHRARTFDRRGDRRGPRRSRLGRERRG